MLREPPYAAQGKSLLIRAVSVPFCGTMLHVELPAVGHRPIARWECGECGHAERVGVGGTWSLDTVVTHVKCQAWRHACRAHPEAVGPLFPWERGWHRPE